MPSLLQRLKERKLFQWALAYLAGAWLVFQGIEVLAEPWNLSEAVQRAIHVLLGIGFLVTLVLAWYHGEKGRQRASGVELLILAGILVIAGAAVAALGRLSPEGEGAIGQQAGADSKIIDAKSVAVLPFDNFSPDPNDAYFADGMQEQLISTLSRISGLSVRGRMSVMRYRDNPKPLPEIAAELGVTFIIEGSARIVGDEVSVTAQLIDAGQDEHLWSEEYDREFSVGNILLIHREIAEHVASQLRTELTPEERERIDSNPRQILAQYPIPPGYQHGRGAFRARRKARFAVRSSLCRAQRCT
jgi:TolB-like protein